MLLKRTLVLSGEKPVGSVNFIRFGNSLGAKLTLNAPYTGVLGLSVDNERRFYPISKTKEEFDFDVPFTADSRLGGALFSADGKPIAWGGRRESALWTRAYVDWQTARAQQATAAAAAAQAAEESEAAIADAAEPPAEQQVEAAAAETTTVPNEGTDQTEPLAEENSDLYAENTTEAPQAERSADPPTGAETQAVETPQTEAPQVETVAEQKGEKQATPEGGDNRGIPFELPLSDDFYASVRSRLEETLTINPTEADLERLIPESRWVKVYYEGDDYYVIGEIRENGEPRLVGYGVPGVESVEPPAEVRGVTDFLPVNDTFGYWLLFQSADNGEILPNED